MQISEIPGILARNRPLLAIQVWPADSQGTRHVAFAWHGPADGGGRFGFVTAYIEGGAPAVADPLRLPFAAAAVGGLLDDLAGADRVTCALDDETTAWLCAMRIDAIAYDDMLASLDDDGRARVDHYLASKADITGDLPIHHHVAAVLGALGPQPNTFIRIFL